MQYYVIVAKRYIRLGLKKHQIKNIYINTKQVVLLH